MNWCPLYVTKRNLANTDWSYSKFNFLLFKYNDVVHPPGQKTVPWKLCLLLCQVCACNIMLEGKPGPIRQNDEIYCTNDVFTLVFHQTEMFHYISTSNPIWLLCIGETNIWGLSETITLWTYFAHGFLYWSQRSNFLSFLSTLSHFVLVASVEPLGSDC